MAALCRADDIVHTSLVRDIASVEGVRENPILGYGLVVGLKGTGDRQQTGQPAMHRLKRVCNVVNRKRTP